MVWIGFALGLATGAVFCLLGLAVLLGVRLRKLLADLLIDPSDCRPVLQLVRLARVGVAAERSLLKNCAYGAVFSNVERDCQYCPARDFCRRRPDL